MFSSTSHGVRVLSQRPRSPKGKRVPDEAFSGFTGTTNKTTAGGWAPLVSVAAYRFLRLQFLIRHTQRPFMYLQGRIPPHVKSFSHSCLLIWDFLFPILQCSLLFLRGYRLAPPSLPSLFSLHHLTPCCAVLEIPDLGQSFMNTLRHYFYSCRKLNTFLVLLF